MLPLGAVSMNPLVDVTKRAGTNVLHKTKFTYRENVCRTADIQVVSDATGASAKQACVSCGAHKPDMLLDCMRRRKRSCLASGYRSSITPALPPIATAERSGAPKQALSIQPRPHTATLAHEGAQHPQRRRQAEPWNPPSDHPADP